MRRVPRRALARLEPIRHGPFGGARFAVVVGQQLGLRLDDLRELALQQLGDLPVILLAGAPQQRLVGGVLDQRVLEDVAGPRRPAALIEQLGLDQLAQPVLQR